MRVAIYGAGGVGGYFGARLIEAGEQVGFVARGSHLDALRQDGLHLRSPIGDAHVSGFQASDRPEDVGPADVVLLCVKTWQLEAALTGTAALVGDETVVLPLQNGVEAATLAAAALGEDRVLGGTCKIMSHVGAPGEIVHIGATPWIALGERGATPSPRVLRIAEMLRNAGIAVEVPDDIDAVIWEKLIFVASVGGVGAVTRAPVGIIRRVPETRAMLSAAMEEIQRLAEARGVSVSKTASADAMRFVDSLPEGGTSSLQRDIAEGRRTELDAWTGAVVRLGEASGVATPVNTQIYASLLPLELRARGDLSF